MSVRSRLQGWQTMFGIELLYGVLFVGGFAVLVYRFDPRVAAFEAGLVVGYILRVWEKMSIYERAIQDAVSEEAEQRVQAEAEQRVGDEVAEQVAAEVDKRVADEVADEVAAEVDERVPEKVEETVTEEVDERVEEEVAEQVTAEVDERLEDAPETDGTS
jgi:uncharacterized membrane protein YheB (UPF0754 family)